MGLVGVASRIFSSSTTTIGWRRRPPEKSLPELPTELWELISFFMSDWDIVRHRRLNRTFYLLASDIRFGTFTWNRKNVIHLCKSPFVPMRVRKFILYTNEVIEDKTTTEDFPVVLQMMQNVQRLCIVFQCTLSYHFDINLLLVRWSSTLVTLDLRLDPIGYCQILSMTKTKSVPLNNLKTLRIQVALNHRDPWISSSEVIAFRDCEDGRIIFPIRSLFSEEFDEHDLVKVLERINMMIPHTLESLSLLFSSTIPFEFRIPFFHPCSNTGDGTTRFPNLKVLRCTGIKSAVSQNLIGFIDTHSQTLEHIHLSQCESLSKPFTMPLSNLKRLTLLNPGWDVLARRRFFQHLKEGSPRLCFLDMKHSLGGPQVRFPFVGDNHEDARRQMVDAMAALM